MANNNFDSIYELNTYNILTDIECNTVVLTNIPNYNVFEELKKEFKEYMKTEGYNDPDLNNDLNEFEDFVTNKGYFFYIPRTNIDIDAIIE